MKKRLTAEQEFQIMKIVLDKFLWIGTILMLVGFYFMLTKTVQEGIYFLISGIVIMILFAWVIVREYEIIKR